MHIGPVTRAPLYSSKDHLHQYMLVAHPDEETSNKVWGENRDCNKLYGEMVAVASRPFIALADFMAKEEMEETLIRWMQRICCRENSFRVTLNNYDGFAPHTIYAKIKDPQPLQAIARQLKVVDGYICSSDCPPLRLAAMPFLIVATLLSADNYGKALKAYQMKNFHDSFMVNELVLLKRSHHFDACRRVNVFRLLPAEGR